MPNNLIIYGGGGFIGLNVLEDLIERDFDITVFDKNDLIGNDNIALFKRIKYIQGDFNNI